MSERDASPIDQLWIRDYCDEFLKAALLFPDGSPMHGAILRRIECVHDLVEAWQKRNVPITERHPYTTLSTGCTCGADMVPGKADREHHSKSCPRREGF